MREIVSASSPLLLNMRHMYHLLVNTQVTIAKRGRSSPNPCHVVADPQFQAMAVPDAGHATYLMHQCTTMCRAQPSGVRYAKTDNHEEYLQQGHGLHTASTRPPQAICHWRAPPQWWSSPPSCLLIQRRTSTARARSCSLCGTRSSTARGHARCTMKKASSMSDSFMEKM
jgi:hypothetical protein